MPNPIKHPELDRTCTVLPAILKACLRYPKSYDQLEAATGSTRGSLHVQCRRLREAAMLVSIDTIDGTKHMTTRKGARGLVRGS